MMTNRLRVFLVSAGLACVVVFGATAAFAEDDHPNGNACKDLPSQRELRAALNAAQAAANGGFGLEMWGTVVNRDGDRLCRRVHGQRPRRSVAGQPRHLRAEGEHRQRVQPAASRALDRQPL